MVLPLLAALSVALAWLVALGVTQVRVVDAARETVRAVARGEVPGRAEQLGRRASPDDATFRLHRSGGLVTVTVSAPVTPPDGLLGFLPGFRVDGSATAAEEGP